MSEEDAADVSERPGASVLVRRAPALILTVGVLVFAIVRIGVWVDDFPNPDIAGITYSADLILDGGLPYRDTQEFKAMGSFWMVAAVFAVFGRGLDTLQLAHAVWLLVGAGAVYRAARILHPQHRLAPPLATALYLLYAPMFTFNYSSWMMPAYAWAFTLGLSSIERGRRRDMILAGVFTVLAFLMKRQAAVLLLVMPALWLWGRARKSPGAGGETWLYWIAGGLLMWAIPFGIYAAHGATSDLVAGLFPFGRASEYVAASPGIPTVKLVRLVSRQLIRFFPTTLLLGAIALARLRNHQPSTMVPALIFVAASIAGTGMGGARFFEHYLVQDVPALALAAAHPAGLSGLTRRCSRLALAVVGLLSVYAVGLQLVEIGRGKGHRYEAMARRLEDGKTASQAAGAFIRARTGPDDRIQVWGWTAWRVYYWADRRAPGRIYKPMGTVTEIHSASTFVVSAPVKLREGPGTEAFMAQMRERPPAFFVHSSSLVDTFGSKVDPMFDFDEWMQMLEREYQPVAQFGDLAVFQRVAE